MHSWETPIMEKMAKWVCSNGGDILEVGFGMGIASNFIQKHNINSHTICEISPDVITNLKKWSSDKPNVKILEGDWFDNRDRLEKYDGILFDTFDDPNLFYFVEEFIYEISKKETKFTIWHWTRSDKIPYENVETEKIEINPPDIDYHHGDYFMLHRITISG
tara:strand:- start:280 stop:765 length:486 start_codon:yes stop_codon:yes gene_type:complete